MYTYSTVVGIAGNRRGKECRKFQLGLLPSLLLLLTIVSQADAATFSTEFDLTEDPVSEGGAWINGKADGLDWADCATINGYIYGLQTGQTGYDDATALLAGTWGSNQTAGAIVYL